MNTQVSENPVRPSEVIAIIPARGGSKGLPKKNIVDLAGKPLIAYSILAAKHSELIDSIIVSTEDEEIAEVAKSWGAEVPFLRPEKLAGDTSGIGEAVSYTLARLGTPIGKATFVELYPTSPFRTPEFIDSMLRILFQGYKSLTTVKKVSFDPSHLYVRDNDSFVSLADERHTEHSWKMYYRSYALLYGQTPGENQRHYYHVLTDNCMLIDIDTPRDLRWAEIIIHEGLFDFGF